MAHKELVFFRGDLLFPCSSFALNFLSQHQYWAGGTSNQNTFERNIRISQVIHFSVYRGNQGENPAAFLTPWYIFIGKKWAGFKDRLIKLRVLLQNFSTTFCTTGCQWACWAECYI